MRSASLLRASILVLALALWSTGGRAATLAERAAAIDAPARGGDRQDWVRAASELRPGASLYLLPHLARHDERDAQDVWRLRYGKGPLVVHALRLELQRQKGSAAEGDRYFIALLRSYLKKNRYGWGTTRALVQELDTLTGGNWQPWFERYVYGTEIPQLPK